MHGIEWRWHSHDWHGLGIAWKGVAQAKAREEMEEKKWKCQEEIAPAKRRHGEMRYAQAKPRIDLHRQWIELRRNAAEPL